MDSGGDVGVDGADPTCPGCGSTEVLPGRVFCRPSCKARYEHRERQANPALFSLGDSLQSEWPDEDDKRNREDPQAVVKSPN